MRIFLCAPWDETVLGRITQYAFKALVDDGHRVEVFDFRRRPYSRWPFAQSLKKTLRRIWPKAPSPYEVAAVRGAVDRDVNQRLLERCRALAPELLLVFCGENIGLRTLEAVRETGATTANWFHDSLIYASRRELVRNVLPAYDLLFLVDDLGVSLLDHLVGGAGLVALLGVRVEGIGDRQPVLVGPDGELLDQVPALDVPR